jgi:hypothetical protein
MSEGPGVLTATERGWLRRVADWPETGSWAELTQPVLARVAAAHGLDFATALLYERLRRSEQHGPFIRHVDGLIAQPPSPPPKADVLLAVAPGAFYRELPRTGGDGRLLREQIAAFGWRTALVPTDGMGSVAANGRLICRWLAEQPQGPIVLASLSKGAADIKAALAEPGAAAAFRSVLAWMNISGMADGSPLVNWMFKRRWATLFYRLMFRLQGLDFALVPQLARGPGAVLNFPLLLPPHIRLISVVGFPLRRHLCTGMLRRYYCRISPQGPNDGLVLLADVCALPGLVYPVWGADHYLRPAWDIRRLVAALAFYLAETLDLQAIRRGEHPVAQPATGLAEERAAREDSP